MTKESEIRVGRPANRARYEECVSRIKKAFADYRNATGNKTEACLKWTGENYILRENGQFVRRDSNKEDIRKLEAEVSLFEKFVASRRTKEAIKETSPLRRLWDIVNRELPEMKGTIGKVVGNNELYWVSRGEYNGYNLEAFRQLVEANTPFTMIHTIPLIYSSLEFEKDKESEYMDSCEVKSYNKSKKAVNLESLFTRALSGIDYIGMIEGKLNIGDAVINISRKRSLTVNITSGNTMVTLRVNPEKPEIEYTCNYPSTEDPDVSLAGVSEALERLCELTYRGDTYTNYRIREVKATKNTSDVNYDALVRLLADIFK